MNPEMPTTPDLSERVGALERENRRLKGLVILLFLGAVLVSRYLPGPKMLEAQYISLRDEDGKQRVLLTANTFAAGVNVFDAREKVQAALSIEKDGPKMTIFDANEKKRIAIGMLDGGPVLMFDNASEQPTLMLMQREDRAGFALLDPEGNVVWSAPAVEKSTGDVQK